jgi:hypothetical protein
MTNDLYDPATPGPYPAPEPPVSLPEVKPKPIRRRRLSWLGRLAGNTGLCIVGACAGLFLLGLWWSASNNDGDALQFADLTPAYPASITPPAAAPGKPVEQAPRSVLAGDGVWKVGRDFKPGIFQTTVPGDTALCVVIRSDRDDVEIEKWIAQPRQALVITVAPSDGFTTVSGCGTAWKRVR